MSGGRPGGPTPSGFGAPFGGDIGGLVLAGGRSTRFGSEKAAALLQGRPLLVWALDHLAAVADPIAVSGPPGSQAEQMAKAGGWDVLHDRPDHPRGPQAGLAAGLAWARANGLDLLAVEPCDTPRLPPDLHSRLRSVMGAAPAGLAITDSGPHPLCGALRRLGRSKPRYPKGIIHRSGGFCGTSARRRRRSPTARLSPTPIIRRTCTPKTCTRRLIRAGATPRPGACRRDRR